MSELVANPYETEKLLEEYLLLHYGAPETVLPWTFGPLEALDFLEEKMLKEFPLGVIRDRSGEEA